MTEDREEAQVNEPDSPEELTSGELLEGEPEELTEELVNEYSHLDLEEQVSALLKDLHSIQKDAGESKDLAQRAQAELSNFRKRTEDDRIALQRQSKSR